MCPGYHGAIVAVAFVTSALALILFALSTGLAFSVVSPLSETGVSLSSLARQPART